MNHMDDMSEGQFSTYVQTCKKCGGKMIDENPSITLTSSPLRFRASCICGNVQFLNIDVRHHFDSLPANNPF